MALPLRFGILAPQVVPYTVQQERWRELDEYGFDSLWLADHFVNPARPSGRWFESQTLMAAAAAQTERIRIGALVTSITIRHPALFAKEALTIDHISGGRLELGIGAAGARNAAVLAAQMLAMKDPKVAEQVEIYKRKLAESVDSKNQILQEQLRRE